MSSPSPLLTLPFELRTQIFLHALSHPPHLVTFPPDHVQAQYYTAALPLPALTRVSKQIRHETLPLYFQANTFILHTEEPKFLDAKAWLRAGITQRFLADLRSVEVWVRYVPLGGARGALGGGCFGVRVGRERKGGRWRVEEGGVRWVTVTRRPVDWEGDVKGLVRGFGEALGGLEEEGAEEWIAVLEGVRDGYCRRKVHGLS
jgi:hypothetical protein